MRISDWSSDVCSSDLRGQRHYGRSGSINMSAPAFISQLDTFAKIEAAHFLIGHERIWAARKKHLSIINDAGAINDIDRFPHIMIGDDHADANHLALAQDNANLGDGDGNCPTTQLDTPKHQKE